MSAKSRFAASQIDSLSAIERAEWNALVRGNPLLSHEFLSAMETSGCVGPGTAWQPCHLLLREVEATGDGGGRDDDGRDGGGAGGGGARPVGALPLYLKGDSRGEFVFDWSWADAYERAGLAYYPKLVTAVPFTPANGERLLIADERRHEEIAAAMIDATLGFARDNGISSWHVLFPRERERAAFAKAGLLERKACQFHWRNDGYRDFDDFLSRFSSAKRKKAKRERRRIAEAGIAFEHLPGDAVSAADWDAIHDFYRQTFYRRGHAPYLNRAFFDRIVETMPRNLLVILARHGREPIAAAICFRSDDALYGRYWGSAADFHSLHFETCYYQGIEYCIREGLQLFEPGTQGEHKISRGFSPTPTWSYHWLREPGFQHAVQAYLERETSHVDAYIAHWDDHLPYRNSAPDDRYA